MAEWEAMLVLEEVIQFAADQLRCRIIREGVPLQFTVRFEQFVEGIRG